MVEDNFRKQVDEANNKNLEKDNDIEKLEKTNDVLKDRKDLKKQLNELNDKYTEETEMLQEENADIDRQLHEAYNKGIENEEEVVKLKKI